MPSGPRSSRVSMRGRPPVRLAKKLLSRRRTHALPVPTMREPLPPGPGTTVSSDWNVDDAEAVDEVARQAAGNDDLEAAADKVDQQTHLRIELGAAQLQPLAADELGRDRQMPSSRALARMAPATSPTPVIARAVSRSGTRSGHGDSLPLPSAFTSTKPVSSNFRTGAVRR